MEWVKSLMNISLTGTAMGGRLVGGWDSWG